MRNTRSAALVGALAMLAAGTAGEHLAAPVDRSLRLAFATPDGSTREWIAPDETVDHWTRMVTLQRLGWRPGLTRRAFAARWTGMVQGACPGAVATPVADLTVEGNEAADLRIDCPRNLNTGLPETVAARLVMGNESLHMIQAAARRRFTPADEDWARRMLAGARICAAESSGPQCLMPASPGH